MKYYVLTILICVFYAQVGVAEIDMEVNMLARDRYDSLFQYYGEVYNFGWIKLKAQARAESNLDSNAVSHCGAKGLAQFMDSTWAEWQTGKRKSGDSVKLDPFNPEWSIRAQAAYMAWLQKQTGGELADALIAYNWGLGNYRKWKSGLKSNLPQETKDYVRRIYGLLDIIPPLEIET